MHILHVVGARPNFMKAAPVLRALRERGAEQTLVHTGQHYDASMSDVFFRQLEIPAPDFNLEVGSGSHSRQTADIMVGFEEVVLGRRPDMVLVYGDVNSTVACALVCAKLGIRVGHVEAGLRSFDRTMPEEINRLVTDGLADLLFTPSTDGDEHLLREGVPKDKIFFVGNVMIDTLVRLLPEAEKVEQKHIPARYMLVTFHRPANVDDPQNLRKLIEVLREVSRDIDVVFPVHPRTRLRLKELGLADAASEHLLLLEPAPYVEFLALQKHAAVVITDSGGIQEETTFLGVPCLTFRNNTERPVTITHGTNRLIGCNPDVIPAELRAALASSHHPRGIPPLWDGHASDRIADVLLGDAES